MNSRSILLEVHPIMFGQQDGCLLALDFVMEMNRFQCEQSAIIRGCDVDKPRNLAKSVTVE